MVGAIVSRTSKWVVASSAVTFGRFAEGPVRRLEEAGCEVRLNPYGRPLTKGEMVEFAGDARAIILGNDPLPASVIKRLRKLRIIARYGVGFDGVDLAEARARNIQVTYAPATNREETADFTMGLILDLERHISQMIISTRSGGWDKIAGTSLYRHCGRRADRKCGSQARHGFWHGYPWLRYRAEKRADYLWRNIYNIE